jgi:hypothetical protein
MYNEFFFKENKWQQFNSLKSVKYNPFYFPLYSTKTLNFTGKNDKILKFTGKTD